MLVTEDYLDLKKVSQPIQPPITTTMPEQTRPQEQAKRQQERPRRDGRLLRQGGSTSPTTAPHGTSRVSGESNPLSYSQGSSLEPNRRELPIGTMLIIIVAAVVIVLAVFLLKRR